MCMNGIASVVSAFLDHNTELDYTTSIWDTAGIKPLCDEDFFIALVLIKTSE